ncbi:MAG: DUF1416 domain-containing protein [Nakamurella sp.]
MTAVSCAPPEQGLGLPAGVDIATQSVVQGKVRSDSAPIAGAFVRLLDSTGEFTAEVVTSADGDFRFFAAPGSWTVRALSRSGNGQTSAEIGLGYNELNIALSR